MWKEQQEIWNMMTHDSRVHFRTLKEAWNIDNPHEMLAWMKAIYLEQNEYFVQVIPTYI